MLSDRKEQGSKGVRELEQVELTFQTRMGQFPAVFDPINRATPICPKSRILSSYLHPPPPRYNVAFAWGPAKAAGMARRRPRSRGTAASIQRKKHAVGLRARLSLLGAPGLTASFQEDLLLLAAASRASRRRIITGDLRGAVEVLGDVRAGTRRAADTRSWFAGGR